MVSFTAIPSDFSEIVLLYAITLVIFFIIDIVWLGVVARQFYQKHLAKIKAENIRWNAALLFYLFYSAGVLIFGVFPAIASANLSVAVLCGGVYGFFTYMTYDLTNRATLAHWPLMLTLVDICWGVALSASVSTLVYLAHFVVV